MRLRSDAHAHEKLAARPERVVILDPEHPADLSQASTKATMAVELGCGKGGFITALAPKHPDVHFFAFEKYETILVKALKKYDRNPVDTITFVSGDATMIDALFPPQSVQTVYLNFSDPWPKARHEKRRLTTPSRLEKYHHILKDDGEIRLKTDNRSLFFYSLATLKATGFEITDFTTDLKQTSWANTPTEFEERYGKTYPIHACVARKKVPHGSRL